ncbi:MAG TPA: nucleoside hydrolase, partial [Solirubrobacteraceae bacterium]|nr:nucleoside hydrolase [Solirubrobacteraceae bacterium]
MTAVILDCDPGHDDAIALLLALASPEIRLLGVTTVSGNQTLEKTTANAIRVLDHLGYERLPVAAGAGRPLVRERTVAPEVHGDSGLDGPALPPPSRSPAPDHAIDWIAATLREQPRPVTLVPTGPLTNIALLLARHPEVEPAIERVVLMGGAIGEGNVTPAAEFNIWADPESARRVFSSSLELTMVGLDVTHRALIGEDHVRRLAAGGAAGRLAAELLGFYGRHHRLRYGWDGAPVHDAVAVAHVIDPEILRTRHCGVRVDTGPELSRGRT